MIQNMNMVKNLSGTMRIGIAQKITPRRPVFADALRKALSVANGQRNTERTTPQWNNSQINSSPTRGIGLPPEYVEMYEEVLSMDGRPAAAMRVVLAQMRAAEYIDYGDVNGKLAELKSIADNADYSGMSAAEKAKVIFDRWDQAFGDFRKVYAEGYDGIPGKLTDACLILVRFSKELQSVFGSTSNARAAYKNAVYGAMSSEDIRAEITARYPPMSEISLREFRLMVYEMYQVAADDGLWKVLQISNSQDMGITGDIYEAMLDKPLNQAWLFNVYNIMRNVVIKSSYFDVGNSGTVLHELFGAGFDERGNIYVNQQALVWFRDILRQLEEMFLKMSTSDYEEWLAEQYENIGKPKPTE